MMNRGDEGARFSPEERQPDGEQIVDPGQHDLDQAAGMLGAVERERQQQDVLEVRHRAQTRRRWAIAVGLQGDDDVGGGCRPGPLRPTGPKQLLASLHNDLGSTLSLAVAQEVDHLAGLHTSS